MLVDKIMVPVSPSGSLATTVVRGVFGRHGATEDQPIGDLGQSGWESDVEMEEFRRNAVGPLEWECEAMGSVVWVQCATSTECLFKLSIAASSVMGISSY